MKNFKPGDKVQLIDGILKGTIVSLSAYKAMIKDEDGFEEEILLTKITFQTLEEEYEATCVKLNVVIEKKEFNAIEKISKANIKKQVLEVDLHIHHLTSSTRNMTNHQMVLLQLNKVKETLRLIDRNKHSKVVFIHGNGTGKLRSELEHELNKNRINYQDASYEKYGRGALEVVF